MATYLELRDLSSNGDLISKTMVAVVIAANNLLSGTPTVSDQKWAASVLSNPQTEGRKALMAVLATNSGLTVAQITGATDAGIQTQVNAVVPDLVAAFNAV